MTPRKQRFIAEYIRLRNGREAALAAGYGETSAAAMASKLLRRGDVQEALIAAGVELAFATYGPGGPKPLTRIAPFLTARQERFIEHYLVLGKGAEAARLAGYSPRSAHSIADKLLHTPRIAAAIDDANAKRAQRMALDADRVLAELMRLGFSDLGKIVDWDADGNIRLKAADEVAPEDRAAIAQLIAVSDKKHTRVKVKLHNKLKALESLGKYLGLFAKAPRGTGEGKLIDGRDPREVLLERIARIVAMAEEDGD